MAGPGYTDTDLRWLRAAIELSRCCPPSDTAFSVGAVLVSGGAVSGGAVSGGAVSGGGVSGDAVLATGFSRERDPHDHAEEVALAKAAEAGLTGAELADATIYTSLEPCLRRLSRPRPCTQLIVAAGIRRVVLAWCEPPLFVPGGGARWLHDQGVTVIEVPQLADEARAVNAHLISG